MSALKNTKATRWVGALLVFLLSFLLYVNTLNHGYVLDDVVAIEHNDFVQQGLAGIDEIFSAPYRYGSDEFNDGLYRPLPLLTFAMEIELFGKTPFAGHFFNVLLYALSCVVLWFLLLRLFPNRLFLPVAATLLFVAHPIHTEVVANIKSREEILGFLFLVLSVPASFKFFRSNQSEIPLLVAGGLFFLLALLSKESAVTYLAAIPLFIYCFSEQFRWKRFVSVVASLLVVLGIYFALRIYALGNLNPIRESGQLMLLNNTLVGAENIWERWPTAFVLLGKYLQLSVFPHPLSYDYSFNQIPVTDWSDGRAWISFLVGLILLLYALIKLKTKSVLSFGILFFFVTLSVSSNLFVLIGTTFAERFLFTPVLGICLVAAAAISYLFRWNKAAPIAVLITVVGLFSFKTFQRNKVWSDNLNLFAHDIQHADQSAKAHFLLGNTLLKKAGAQEHANSKKALLSQSKRYLTQATEIYPDYLKAHQKLASIYSAQNDYAHALSHYKQIERIDSTITHVYYHIGNCYYHLNRLDSAEWYTHKEIDHAPGNKFAYNNLALIALKRKQYEKSIDYFDQAIAKDSTYLQAYDNKLTVLLKILEDEKRVIETLDRVVRQFPNEVQYRARLCETLYNSDQTEAAFSCMEQLIGVYQKLGFAGQAEALRSQLELLE